VISEGKVTENIICNTLFDIGNLVDIDVGVVMSNEQRT